jgi:hypothetical protein
MPATYDETLRNRTVNYISLRRKILLFIVLRHGHHTAGKTSAELDCLSEGKIREESIDVLGDCSRKMG